MCRRWCAWCASSGCVRLEERQWLNKLFCCWPTEPRRRRADSRVSAQRGERASAAADVIEEIQHRYSLIGRSPLTEITWSRAAGGSRTGRGRAAGEGLCGHAQLAAVHSRRGAQMRADGVEEAAVLCMAPQNSRTSVGLYRRAVEAEAAGMRIDFTARMGASSAADRSICRAAAARAGKLSAKVGHPVPCCSRRTACLPHRAGSRRERKASRGFGPARAPTPTRKRPRDRRAGGPRVPEISAVVVRLSEPGRERRPVDWPERGESLSMPLPRRA
jgi:hypothetical protein